MKCKILPHITPLYQGSERQNLKIATNFWLPLFSVIKFEKVKIIWICGGNFVLVWWPFHFIFVFNFVVAKVITYFNDQIWLHLSFFWKHPTRIHAFAYSDVNTWIYTDNLSVTLLMVNTVLLDFQIYSYVCRQNSYPIKAINEFWTYINIVFIKRT